MTLRVPSTWTPSQAIVNFAIKRLRKRKNINDMVNNKVRDSKSYSPIDLAQSFSLILAVLPP